MTQANSGTVERKTTPASPAPLPGGRDATWRFIGDRAAADRAYCARFGVSQAPEPIVALGGAWAYALPIVAPPH
jgi:hypothetical protein